MHELPVTKSILEAVLCHAQAVAAQKIVRIHLVVGELNEFKRERIQRYFDYLSRDTPAEGALQAAVKPVVGTHDYFL